MEIKTIEEAIKYLEEKAGINVMERNKAKWDVWDDDFDDVINTDEDLIDYANEQKEAIEVR